MSAKYYIYRNLHTGGFSVRYKGEVIDRPNVFGADGVTFKVNEGGRQRVIKEKKKNVHAFVVADKYSEFCHAPVDGTSLITYNPYVADYFTCEGNRIDSAKEVTFFHGKCYLIEE